MNNLLTPKHPAIERNANGMDIVRCTPLLAVECINVRNDLLMGVARVSFGMYL